MDLLVLGGDLRFAYLAAQLRGQGMDVAATGLEHSNVEGIRHVQLERIRDANAVVFMNPFLKGIVQPYAEQPLVLDSVLERLSPGTKLILFGVSGAPEWVRTRFSLIDLSQDEAFLVENAHLTAEGAIYAAMQKASFSLHRTDCMVVGFGRIGTALTRMLTGFGARVTVAARRANARAHARLFGAMTVDMEDMLRAIPVQRIIFTTPPEEVLDVHALSQIRKDALLIDLSSPPYSFSLKEAKALGLNAWLEPGIPGRYCPESAAKALGDVVRIALKDRGVEF